MYDFQRGENRKEHAVASPLQDRLLVLCLFGVRDVQGTFLSPIDVAYGYLHSLNTSFHPGKAGVEPKAPRGNPRHSTVRGHRNQNITF